MSENKKTQVVADKKTESATTTKIDTSSNTNATPASTPTATSAPASSASASAPPILIATTPTKKKCNINLNLSLSTSKKKCTDNEQNKVTYHAEMIGSILADRLLHAANSISGLLCLNGFANLRRIQLSISKLDPASREKLNKILCSINPFYDHTLLTPFKSEITGVSKNILTQDIPVVSEGIYFNDLVKQVQNGTPPPPTSADEKDKKDKKEKDEKDKKGGSTIKKEEPKKESKEESKEESKREPKKEMLNNENDANNAENALSTAEIIDKLEKENAVKKIVLDVADKSANKFGTFFEKVTSKASLVAQNMIQTIPGIGNAFSLIAMVANATNIGLNMFDFGLTLKNIYTNDIMIKYKNDILLLKTLYNELLKNSLPEEVGIDFRKSFCSGCNGTGVSLGIGFPKCSKCGVKSQFCKKGGTSKNYKNYKNYKKINLIKSTKKIKKTNIKSTKKYKKKLKKLKKNKHKTHKKTKKLK